MLVNWCWCAAKRMRSRASFLFLSVPTGVIGWYQFWPNFADPNSGTVLSSLEFGDHFAKVFVVVVGLESWEIVERSFSYKVETEIKQLN